MIQLAGIDVKMLSLRRSVLCIGLGRAGFVELFHALVLLLLAELCEVIPSGAERGPTNKKRNPDWKPAEEQWWKPWPNLPQTVILSNSSAVEGQLP